MYGVTAERKPRLRPISADTIANNVSAADGHVRG